MEKDLTIKLFRIAAIIYLIAAIFSVGNHHPDEHFQIFEFAALKLGLTHECNLPWEFHFQMRPTIQPAMVVMVHRFFGLFGWDNPFFVAFVMRLMSAVLSLYSIWLMVDLYLNRFQHGIVKYWYVILSLFVWISVYNNVRFSSENWSGSLFVIGFALIMKQAKPKNWRYLVAGALFGLSFVIRYQLAFMVLGFGLWLLIQRKDVFSKLVLMTLAFFAMVGLGALIDKWYYGEWVITTWNYLKHNIIEDKVSGFGIEPWYYYLTKIFLDLIPPLSLIYIVPFLWMIYKRSKSAIVWTIIPFLLIHFLIGHKETRFMYPIIGLLPVAIAYMIDWMMLKKGEDLFVRSKPWYWFKKLFWITNVALLAVISFTPANTTLVQLQAMYRGIKGPAVVYYETNSPFGDGLQFSYNMRPDIELAPMDILPGNVQLEKGKQVFVATENYDTYLKYKNNGRLIYRSYPEFLRHLDINGWIGRTSWYYFIEIDSNNAPK